MVTGPNSVPTESPAWGVVKKATNANSSIMVQHSCRIPWLWSGSKGLQLNCGTARLPNSAWRIASLARHLCSVPHLSGAVPATLLLSPPCSTSICFALLHPDVTHVLTSAGDIQSSVFHAMGNCVPPHCQRRADLYREKSPPLAPDWSSPMQMRTPNH